MAAPEFLLPKPDLLDHFGNEVQRLKEQLLALNLLLSAKTAGRLHILLTKVDRDRPAAWAKVIMQCSQQLRERQSITCRIMLNCYRIPHCSGIRLKKHSLPYGTTYRRQAVVWL